MHLHGNEVHVQVDSIFEMPARLHRKLVRIMSTSTKTLADIILRVRQRAPLVHNVTNYVGMDLTANALLAYGASPVMAHAAEEVAEMAGQAAAVVINIGTLSGPWVQSMRKAIASARDRGIPVIFDPVGVGATHYRTSTARMLLDEGGVSVIRGNASEIQALAHDGHFTKGVDTTAESSSAIDAAQALTSTYGITTVVSGATDYVVATSGIVTIQNGSPVLTKITGMGCTVSALVAACCATHRNFAEAATAGMVSMGICAELAEERLKLLPQSHQGPGSFRSYFLDALYTLNADALLTRARVTASPFDALDDLLSYRRLREDTGLSTASLALE